MLLYAFVIHFFLKKTVLGVYLPKPKPPAKYMLGTSILAMYSLYGQ